MIKLKRAYDEPASSDGVRLLVEDLAPTTERRKWFGHDGRPEAIGDAPAIARLNARHGARAGGGRA